MEIEIFALSLVPPSMFGEYIEVWKLMVVLNSRASLGPDSGASIGEFNLALLACIVGQTGPSNAKED